MNNMPKGKLRKLSFPKNGVTVIFFNLFGFSRLIKSKGQLISTDLVFS